MNEGQENFNENLDTTVNNVDNTGLNEVETPFINPEPTPVVDPTPIEEPTPVEEPKPMMEAHPIDAPIPEPAVVPEPVVNTSSSVSSNGNKKGNKGLIVVIIILVALLLGAVGYILYSNGIFGEKNTEPKTTEKEDNKEKEEEKKTDKEQIVKVDLSKYTENENTKVGTITLGEKKYNITAIKYNCKTVTGQVPEECSNFDYVVDVDIVEAEVGTKVKHLRMDGLTEIAVLDDRYVFINTGEFGDRAPAINNSMFLLDSKNSFESNELLDYGYGLRTVTSNEESKIGYVDSNTFKYGSCLAGSNPTSKTYNKFVEYTVTIKDGTITVKDTKTIDNIVCTAQQQ